MDHSIDIIYDKIRVAYYEIYNKNYMEDNVANHEKFILDVNKVLELMFRGDIYNA